jgi:hypothetical protein
MDSLSCLQPIQLFANKSSTEFTPLSLLVLSDFSNNFVMEQI